MGGDLGYYDRDGVVHYVEKISNLISFWMYEVAPTVLESRLLSHGSVVDAAVIAVPDKEMGHIPRGFVVLKQGYEETEENLLNFLESRLQDHERLRGGLYYIQQVPRDENWKVQKSVLDRFVPPIKSISEEIFGMRSRSRRGSQDNVLEEKEKTEKQGESYERLEEKGVDKAEGNLEAKEGGLGAGTAVVSVDDANSLEIEDKANHGKERDVNKKDGRSNGCLEGEREVIGGKGEEGKEFRREGEDVGTSLEESTESIKQRKNSDKNMEFKEEKQEREKKQERDDIEYWVRVSVNPTKIENLMSAHSGVKEVIVRGVSVPGLGLVPRAYIALHTGVCLSPRQILDWCNTTLEWQYRLRGGLVVTNKLPTNLDSLDKLAVGVDQTVTQFVPDVSITHV